MQNELDSYRDERAQYERRLESSLRSEFDGRACGPSEVRREAQRVYRDRIARLDALIADEESAAEIAESFDTDFERRAA